MRETRDRVLHLEVDAMLVNPRLQVDDIKWTRDCPGITYIKAWLHRLDGPRRIKVAHLGFIVVKNRGRASMIFT